MLAVAVKLKVFLQIDCILLAAVVILKRVHTNIKKSGNFNHYLKKLKSRVYCK